MLSTRMNPAFPNSFSQYGYPQASSTGGKSGEGDAPEVSQGMTGAQLPPSMRPQGLGGIATGGGSREEVAAAYQIGSAAVASPSNQYFLHHGFGGDLGGDSDDADGGVNKADERWRVLVEELRQYKEEHGDCLVPARYAPNRKLGHWVMTQRRQYQLMQEGKPSALTPQRVVELDAVGFIWMVRENKAEVWNRRLEELKLYRAQFGDCLVPQRYSPNPPLGTWVNTQRRHFKLLQDGKRSSMTDERIMQLERLGFEWKAPKDVPGKRAYQDDSGDEERLSGTDISDASIHGGAGSGKRTSTTPPSFDRAAARPRLQRFNSPGIGMNFASGDFRYSNTLPGNMPYGHNGQMLPSSGSMLPVIGQTAISSPQRQLAASVGPPTALHNPANQLSTSSTTGGPLFLGMGNPRIDMMHHQMNPMGNMNMSNVPRSWVCSFCQMAFYGTEVDAFAHEARCRLRTMYR